MRAKMWIPIALFVAGIALIAAAVATGEAEVSLVVIFPVFQGSSGLFLLGIILIVLSFVVGFAFLAMGQAELDRYLAGQTSVPQRPQEYAKTKYGGVVLVGPVPIAFGSDKNTAIVMLVIGVLAAIAVLALLIMLA